MFRCIRLYWKVGIVLVACSRCQAKTLFHWAFDGSHGNEVVSDTDSVSGVALEKSRHPDPNVVYDIRYDTANPWRNGGGTSIELDNDRAHSNLVGQASLVAADGGEDTPLDLSNLTGFTIELFIYPHAIQDCVLLDKRGGDGHYGISLLDHGDLRFSLNSESNAVSAGRGTVRAHAWHHVAATFDSEDSTAPMKLYVDGRLVASGGSSQRVADSTHDLGVGARVHSYYGPGAWESFFTGRIDELRISDTALIPDQFLLNAEPTRARFPRPEDRAEQFSRTTGLAWQPADGVSSQRIYFGTDPAHLPLLREVGPNVSSIDSSALDGKLDAGISYSWRVDSSGSLDTPGKGDSRYTFDGGGKGTTWRFTTQSDQLEKGYLKWLLHLGQRPEDRFKNPYGITRISRQPDIQPAPGEIWDFADEFGDVHPTTHNLMMIWTPQYSPTGFFADDWWDHWYSQYYHVYLYSPEERPARLRFRAIDRLRVWNNGQLICETNDSAQSIERYADFTLHEGVNSMTLLLTGGGSEETPWQGNYLAVRITDCNDNEFPDLTYSLEPPLPDAEMRVSRILPADYDPGSTIPVGLEVTAASQAEPNGLSIIEYIPQGTTVADAGGGQIIHNTIWWTVSAGEVIPDRLGYRLAVSPERAGTVAFSGYLYRDREFVETAGDKVVFEEPQVSPADMADSIETIELFPGEYTQAEGITIGDGSAEDASGSLESHASGLVSGLKPHQTGGWAEYEFSVEHGGAYHVILDYGELWTMFHHSAPVQVVIDGAATLDAQLFPTTHSYIFPHAHQTLYDPGLDPERKAKWTVGSVDLAPGRHSLRLSFPQMYPANQQLDQRTDGRPVVTRIIVTNYPGLTPPDLAEPHHLDSYEPPPAMMARDRAITKSADGRLEIAFHGTFYSLSQGNELYFADPHPWPQPGSKDSRFEIVSIEPQVFHLPPEGQQDFVLTVRSREPVPDDYSELVMVWLQGVPASPARKPYLFTTTQRYITLPPWEPSQSFWMIMSSYTSWYVPQGIADPAEAFLPSRDDLGFNNGRYHRGPVQYLEDQLRAGKLPSVAQVFQHNGWEYDHPYYRWDETWASLLSALYAREGMGLQAKHYALRLAETSVFYPAQSRWDWARPEYLPRHGFEVSGCQTLGLAIRASREQLVTDEEQFRILHNLVLPIFNAYWDELRTRAILTQDAAAGDTVLRVERPAYGLTGCPTDGFSGNMPAYVLIGDEHYSLSAATRGDTIVLTTPLSKSYPQGTAIASWAYTEGWELEAMDLMSLVAIGAAGRDPALVDQVMSMYTQIMEKHRILLDDGSFRNEPGSYGSIASYAQTLRDAQQWFGRDLGSLVSPTLLDRIHQAILNISQFPFSNGRVPHLNGGGCMNQLSRSYFTEVDLLDDLFPDDVQNIALYRRIAQQEQNREPGDTIENHNFVVHGWGYAMLRSENGSWDRGMETLLSSKYLMSDPGDHVSCDSLGLVVYGLGAILTPRYGYSWIGFAAPLLNQVMVDNDLWDNSYYGSFWHFDGREELPSAVAHTGDGADCSLLNRDMSRWCIQFPEYLFDAYFIEAKDPNVHQFDWCFTNMGELSIVEPQGLPWQDCPEFMADYWPTGEGAGAKTIAAKASGRIVVDWVVSNGPWVAGGDATLLREPPQHSGRLRLTMADDSPSELINAQIGYYRQWNGEQTLANSQDVLAVRKIGAAHVFVDTLEPIADDEQPYVKDVTVVARGNHLQQLVKVTTAEGQDWVYLSGRWNARPDGDHPVVGITTDGDIVAWRTKRGVVTRVYIANGSYASTPDGRWQFGFSGSHYIDSEH